MSEREEGEEGQQPLRGGDDAGGGSLEEEGPDYPFLLAVQTTDADGRVDLMDLAFDHEGRGYAQFVADIPGETGEGGILLEGEEMMRTVRNVMRFVYGLDVAQAFSRARASADGGGDGTAS